MAENLITEIEYIKLVNLVEKAQKGDDKSNDKIFELLIDDMNLISKKYMNKYYFLSTDESEYKFFVFLATQAAINNFDPKLGNFIHYWRRCISSYKCKFLEKHSKNKQVNLNENMFDYYRYDNSKELIFSDSESYIEEENNGKDNERYKELYDKILNLSNILPADIKILRMYSLSYSFNEIAKALNSTKNQVISRFYYLVKIIRERLDFEDYI